MHELSLAGNIVDIVESAALKDDFRRVRTLRLSAPALSGVETGALRFALEALAPRTVLDGAELLIDEPAAKAHCPDCVSDIEVNEYGTPCPACGGHRWRVVESRGLQVVDLLVE